MTDTEITSHATVALENAARLIAGFMPAAFPAGRLAAALRGEMAIPGLVPGAPQERGSSPLVTQIRRLQAVRRFAGECWYSGPPRGACGCLSHCFARLGSGIDPTQASLEDCGRCYAAAISDFSSG